MTDTSRDSRPRFQQIAAHIRALIMAGELPPGAQLPSTRQLMGQYDAASPTVQRALQDLKTEGFLTSRAGKGVYVRDRPPLVVRVGSYIPPSPTEYTSRLLGVVEAPPPADVAEALNLRDGIRVIRRHRIGLYNGEPLEVFWSYYPLDIAAGSPLASQAKIRGGAPAALATLGYPLRYFTDRVSARLPTTEEFEALDMPVDVPVLRQLRVMYSDTRPVEVTIIIKGAHRYELLYRETVTHSC